MIPEEPCSLWELQGSDSSGCESCRSWLACDGIYAVRLTDRSACIASKPAPTLVPARLKIVFGEWVGGYNVLIEVLIDRAHWMTLEASLSSASCRVQRLLGTTTCTAATGWPSRRCT